MNSFLWPDCALVQPRPPYSHFTSLQVRSVTSIAFCIGTCRLCVRWWSWVQFVWTVPHIHLWSSSPVPSETVVGAGIGFVSRGARFIVVAVDYFHPLVSPSTSIYQAAIPQNLWIRVWILFLICSVLYFLTYNLTLRHQNYFTKN